MLLSQFYGRRNSLQSSKKEPNQQEEDIINSFYEERKSRSTQNIKQHNLLRKNISYFHQEGTSPPKAPALQEPTLSNFIHKIPQKKSEVPSQSITPAPNVYLSRPPIPKSMTADNEKVSTQALTPLPLKQSSHNISQMPSSFSGISLSRTGSQQSDFKAHLKYQLNKRVNIQHYLAEINHDNKENTFNQPLPTSMSKLKYNYDSNVPQRLPTDNISEEFSLIFCHQNGESRAINQSHQSSISSLLQDTQNNFQYSRNSLTDRIQPPILPRDQSFSQYRNNVPTLGDSSRRSQATSRKSDKGSTRRQGKEEKEKHSERESLGRHVLGEDELQELHQNSHPIREGNESQSTTIKHNLKFFEPEVYAEYKTKIGDFERQLEALRYQYRREDKFIQSIQKMRRLMDGAQEDASLKELWRWIKSLPQRK